MTLAEAILQVESWFQVHRDIGFAEPYYHGDKPIAGTETRDVSRAPCGEPYVMLTSGGLKSPANLMPMLFADEAGAVRWWLYGVEDYAESVQPDRDAWKKLHLYWRDFPTWDEREYVAVDQADLLKKAHPLAAELMALRLGVVYSRLLITKLEPDGTEED